MSSSYNKFLLSKALDKIIQFNRKKSFKKFLDVYTYDSIQKELSNFPSFCAGIKYLPFGSNIMLKISLEITSPYRSKVTVTGENDEIILSDSIPSSGTRNLQLLLVTITDSKSKQQKTFLIENTF